MRRYSLAPLLVLAASLAACGGQTKPPDPRPVAEGWVHALGRADFVAACRLAVPAVTSELKRYGAGGAGSSCASLARIYLPVLDAGKRALMRVAHARSVSRSGEEADVSFGGGVDGVLLARASGAWRVAIPGLDERVFFARTGGWCQLRRTDVARAPIAPGTTRLLARFLEMRARDVDIERAVLAGIEAPPRHAAVLRRMRSALDHEAAALRAAAALADGGASRARLRRAFTGRYASALRESGLAAQQLHLGCGAPPRGDPDAVTFHARASGICRATGRALDAIDIGSSRSEYVRSLERIVGVEDRARRALARLRPPSAAAPVFRAALRLLLRVDREILRGRDAARAGDEAATAKAVKLAANISKRAVNGFERAGLPDCRNL